MRIAILCDNYPTGVKPTAGAFVHARAKAYQSTGNHVLVITDTKPEESYSDCYENIRIAHAVDSQSCRRVLDNWKPDVLCIHSPVKGNVTMMIYDRVPTVVWIHGYEALFGSLHGYYNSVTKQVFAVPRDVFRLYSLRRFLSRCAGVVYVSNWMQKIAERSLFGFRHLNSAVIPNMIDTELFRPSGRQLDSVMGGVSVRSLTNKKYGIDLAIRAYVGIEDSHLTIIGSGCLLSHYTQMIYRSQSNASISPAQYPHGEMPNVYSAYDYFVSPSRTEAQGVAMCEAMSCGLPVVATSAGGIPEFVRDSVDGYLVPKGDWRSLHQAVKRLVEDPSNAARLGANARSRMISICAKDVVLGHELDFLKKIVCC